MKNDAIQWLTGLAAMALGVGCLLWPAAGLALDKQAVYIVGANWQADEDCLTDRTQSKEFMLHILSILDSDLRGEMENPAFGNQIRRCHETVSVGDLLSWLEDQIEHIKADENAVPAPECARAGERGDDDDYEEFLTDMWGDRNLDQKPALVLMDYEGRWTYFYSESSGIEPEYMWKAMSPVCFDETCTEQILKEQRPMAIASRILLLQYLATEQALDRSGRYFAQYLIDDELDEINDTQLPNRSEIAEQVQAVVGCGG